MVLRISLRVCSSMLSCLSKVRVALSAFPSDGILQTFWPDAIVASIMRPGQGGDDTSSFRQTSGYPTTRAIAYNTQQDGKYDAEAVGCWAGARSRSCVAHHLRTTHPPHHTGRGTGQPGRLFKLRLPGSRPGRTRTRPERPERPRL